jgi:hypothetical protein
MTKIHQDIFAQIKALLKEQFKADLIEDEEGTHLTIADSGIWISANDTELTIGYGFDHTHYNPEYDNILGGVERFFNLLTKRKKITSFFKGELCYKNKIEIELAKDIYDDMGTSMTWLYPFWKVTVEKVTFDDKLIDSIEFENSIAKIKNYAQQHQTIKARPQ